MKITIPKNRLTSFKDVISSLIKMTVEVKFILKLEGVQIRALTGDKATAIDFLLKSKMFKDYNIKTEETHIIRVADFTTKKFKAFKNDLELDFGSILTMKSGKIKFTLPTYNEEEVTVFDIPEPKDSVHFDIPSSEYANMVDIFEEVSSNPVIALDVTNDSIIFSAKDYDHITSCEFGIEKKTGDVLGEVTCAFSHNILKYLCQKITDNGTFYVTTDRPMFYISEDDDVRLVYMVAPRGRD